MEEMTLGVPDVQTQVTDVLVGTPLVLGQLPVHCKKLGGWVFHLVSRCYPELSSFLFGSLILERTSLPDCKGPGRACSRRCGHRCCPGKDLCKIFLGKQS